MATNGSDSSSLEEVQNADNPGPSPEFVEVVRIQEQNKTNRTIAIGIVIVLGLGILTYGAVQIWAKPGWVEIVSIIIVLLLGPSGVMYTMLGKHKRYIRKTHSRVVDLEKMIDKDRSSSDLDSE